MARAAVKVRGNERSVERTSATSKVGRTLLKGGGNLLEYKFSEIKMALMSMDKRISGPLPTVPTVPVPKYARSRQAPNDT